MRERVVALGEIMLRLKSPGCERLLQTPRFEATFGGSEANVAAALALWGMDAALITALPKNDIADACLRELRGLGVDVSHILRTPGRMGTYYLEQGAGQRAGKVTYDREGSAFSLLRPGDIDWDAALDGACWLHLTGITPALTQNAADTALAAAREAQARGMHVSLDINYRQTLWQYGRSARDVLSEMMPFVDTLIANVGHFSTCLGITETARESVQNVDAPALTRLAQAAVRRYPSLKSVAVTLRESISADHNDFCACLYQDGALHVSRAYQMTDIVDRVGGGDAFCAGLIYSLLHGQDAQSALSFAAAAGCLKHTVPGDYIRASVNEIKALALGEGLGRVLR